MALPQIVQTLLELAEQVESNNISESDARDRAEQVTESLAVYSAVTDLHINEILTHYTLMKYLSGGSGDISRLVREYSYRVSVVVVVVELSCS